jgi:hypothetical protein
VSLTVRRVLSAHVEGIDVFTSVAELTSRHPPLIGNEILRLWASDDVPSLPAGDEINDLTLPFFPAPGGLRVAIWTVPSGFHEGPTAANTPDNRALTEEIVPGMMSVSVDPSGLHTTPSIDIQFILSGEVDLIHPDGAYETLRAGDVLILVGTTHGWRNKTTEDCAMLGIFYGGRS